MMRGAFKLVHDVCRRAGIGMVLGWRERNGDEVRDEVGDEAGRWAGRERKQRRQRNQWQRLVVPGRQYCCRHHL